MAKEWQQSYSSKVVTPRHLKADQVSWADVPHALAQRVRFAGQLQALGYSVAQHCVLGAEQIAGPFKLPFLLHEVSEVYLPDVPRPIKPFLTVEISPGYSIPWTVLEAQHADAFFEALGLSSLRPLIDSHEVHEMDLRMLATEKRDLASPEPQPWGLTVEPLEMRIPQDCWAPAYAKQRFSDLYHQLLRAF